MHLILIRHADAEDLRTSDEERSLTDEGKKKMIKVAQAVSKIAPSPGLIISSPLVRAIQTAGIVRASYGAIETEIAGYMRSEIPPSETLAGISREAAGLELVACVGHEPNLSGVISLALSGAHGSFVLMRTASACCISFKGNPRPGGAVLNWFITPETLQAVIPQAT